MKRTSKVLCAIVRGRKFICGREYWNLQWVDRNDMHGSGIQLTRFTLGSVQLRLGAQVVTLVDTAGVTYSYTQCYPSIQQAIRAMSRRYNLPKVL